LILCRPSMPALRYQPIRTFITDSAYSSVSSNVIAIAHQTQILSLLH
jgi:hypothetical protein